MPPVIVPVLVGIAAGSAAFAAGVVLSTAYAIGAMASMAAMMLTTKTPSFSDFRGASERSQVLRAASSSKVAVYGRVISSGLLSNAKEQVGDQSDGELIYLALTIAGHKISGLGRVWLGDDLIETYGDLASHELHNDRQTCDPYMLANCPNWREDMIGRGIAWVRFTLKFNAEKFPSGLPNIKMEKFGAEVWDPRDNKVKLTDNAALVILDYYRRWLKVPDDELRLNEFIIAANICDELITLKDGTTEKRYAINGEFDLSEAPAKILEDMHMSCAGQPTYVSGMHGIIVGAYYGPASEDLFDHQLQGDIDLLPEPPASDRINTVVGTFIDGETFQKMDFPAVKVDQWVEEDDGQELTEDLDFRFVTSPWQAQRLANILLRQRRTSRTITCSVNLSGWQYRPGSYLRLYIPALGINGVEFRVVDWSFDLMDGVQLTLREESAAVWADAVGLPMERPDITDLPVGGLAMPDQLRYEVETVGEIIQGVLSWRNVGTIAYNQVIIQRLAAGKPPVTVMTAQSPGESCRINGLAAGNYVALVRSVALTGAHSPIASVNFVIEVPAIPVGVEVEAGNWSLAFRPRFTGGQSYGTLCEWWWSKKALPLAEVQAKATNAGLGAYMTFQGLQPDTTYYVWLRAVNAYGKSGLLAASGKTSYDAASILDILDGEIGGEHLREELRKPIEQIPDIAGKLELVEREFTDLNEIVAPIADRVPQIDHQLTEIDAALTAVIPLAERVPQLDHQLTGLGAALTALDARSKKAEDLLQYEQVKLGEMGISSTLQQDKLHGKIDRVQTEMGDLRDAIFTLDPETGVIEMDVVRALRDETQASFTEVNQKLDAATGTLATKADHAVVDAQGERLTEAEQVLDGINAALTQTVTKSEFTAQGERLTEVSSSLDATKGELVQKAAQSTVTAQGERLAAAEQRITANSDATSALAERVSGLKAELEGDDQTLLANITEVAKVSAEADKALGERVSGIKAELERDDQTLLANITEVERVSVEADKVLAQRVSGVEIRTGTAEGKIRALEEVVEDAGGITAGRFDEITAAIDLTAAAAIANALAGDQGEQRHRTAEAAIRHDQKVQLDQHQALASEVTDLTAKFEGEKADTAARITVAREVIAGVEQSTAKQITQLKTEYREADRQTNAALEESSKTLSDADQALAEQIGQLKTSTGEQASELTKLEKVVSNGQQATGEALQLLTAKTDKTQATVGTLSEVVSEQGKALAAKQDDLSSEVDLTALASIGNTLADEKGEARARKASAVITQRQETQADDHQALAREVTQFKAEFEGEKADTTAALTVVREVIAGVEQSTAWEFSQLKTEYQEADRKTNAALEESSKALSDADQAMSERVTQLQATLEGDDRTLNAALLETQRTQAQGDQALAEQIGQLKTSSGEQSAQLTSLGKVVSDGQQATGEALQQLTAKTDKTQAAVGTLSEVVSEQGKALAAKQDDLSSEVDLTALASIGNTLADEKGEARARKASAVITQRQETQADDHQALAREVTQFKADFEGEKADTSAALTVVREVIAGVEQSTAKQITQLNTDYQEADRKTNAALEESSKTLSAADQAMAERVTQLQATLEGDDRTLNAAILETQRTQAQGDQALSERVTQLQAKVVADDKVLDAVIKQNQQAQVTGDSALATRMDQMQATLEGDDRTLNAAILETQRTQAQGDQALASSISQLQAKVTDGDKSLSAAIQQTQQAQVAGDKANAEQISKVQATLNNTTAAVQTVASAVADLEGDVEAGWYTKAQINGEGGGFGLSVKLNADGTVLSTFVIDADVFAVMSRAGGATTKRNPFIIKNGTVYMNHALMDTAEIGNVIAKYIKVTNLSAITIENSQFKGGNAGFGPGGPYSGWGEGWHTIIYNDGRIFTNKLYAADGSFTGEVNANRGTMNNVVIRENCQILGTLDVNQIVGDITQLIRALANFSIPAYRRARNLVCLKPVTGYGRVSGYGTIGMAVICYLNGVEKERATRTEYVATGGTRYFSIPIQPAFDIPANTAANITFGIELIGGNDIRETGFSGQASWISGLK